MKQTAVEKLINEISIDRIGQAIIKTFFKEFEEAKKLEREQKIDFARHCLDKATDLDILTSYNEVEQYYNENFKSE